MLQLEEVRFGTIYPQDLWDRDRAFEDQFVALSKWVLSASGKKLALDLSPHRFLSRECSQLSPFPGKTTGRCKFVDKNHREGLPW